MAFIISLVTLSYICLRGTSPCTSSRMRERIAATLSREYALVLSSSFFSFSRLCNINMHGSLYIPGFAPYANESLNFLISLLVFANKDSSTGET